MPQLSIIVPVYKVEKYLSRCVESILNQTYKDFELILVDDGSPDQCGKICDEYAALDTRVQVIHQKNQGAFAARNTGLRSAKGSLIGFVDSDDFIDIQMYERLISAMKESETDMAMCDFIMESEKESYEKVQWDEKDISTTLLKKEDLYKGMFGKGKMEVNYLVIWNKVFKKELLAGIEFENVVADDSYFALLAYERIGSYVFVQAPFYHFIQRGDSITHQGISYQYQKLLTYRKMAEHLENTIGRHEKMWGEGREAYENCMVKICKHALSIRYENKKKQLQNYEIRNAVKEQMEYCLKKLKKAQNINMLLKIGLLIMYRVPAVYSGFRLLMNMKES